nr:ketol-acid reductoisomerase [candidate division Zixibacteria bacterium]
MSAKINIAVVGYGSQGRAWALNLRDSGMPVTIGIPAGDASRKTALKDGFKDITSVGRAVESSHIIVFAFPDHLHGRAFKKAIEPYLRPKSALVFLHGYSIHFGTVIPPKITDIILLAPLGPGTAVREKYLAGESIGYFYAVHHNATGRARRVLDYLVRGLKIDRRTMIKTTFADEAIGDLFGEQAVLCGGLSQLIKMGFETLVESGIAPDKAYLEVAYQLDLIVGLIKDHGIEGMFHRISVAARYGSLLNGPRIIGPQAKSGMKKILAEIKSGQFAKKLNSLSPAEVKKLDTELRGLTDPLLEKSARKFSPIKSKKK